ncbi:MAG TPA: OsmC family protein [Thermoanaerobaculia bacterium]|nr:OsmC family protein [Thermoanaerobaculia bacterium]
MNDTHIRRYEARAQSTDVFGRVLCACRDHHFVVDGPVGNGCPGQAVTPAEIFLAGVAACGVELVGVIAKEKAIALSGVRVAISGMMDKSRPVRPDVTLFQTVRLEFELSGVSRAQGEELVAAFRGR